MMIFLILFNIFATVFAVPTSLLNTLAFNTTTTSSIARRWNHGGCSFHVTIKEYCDWDQRPHRGGWQLFTTVHIPWIRDGKDQGIPGLTWGEGFKKNPEKIENGPKQFNVNTEKEDIYGLDNKLRVQWKSFNPGQGSMLYEYRDCKWSGDDYFGSRKCANCGRGLWTNGDSPAQSPLGSNKGCDARRIWRVSLTSFWQSVN